MAYTIKYWQHLQGGKVTNAAANTSTVVPFCTNFSGLPLIFSNYVGCEGSTTCRSAVSTASFTLHTGLAGTVDWLAVYTTTC